MIKNFTLIISLAFLSMSFMPTTQDLSDRVARLIQSGNAKGLSNYFADDIDLKIIDNQNVYSKAQATLVVQNFFKNNPPTAFKLIHKGKSQRGLEYRIGRLSTKTSEYRVTFHLKPDGNSFLISQLFFEKA